MQALELGARLQPELRVEVRERLVHQVDGRVADNRARQGDALLLAAGELRRFSRQQLGQADARRRFAHPPIDLGGLDAAGAQRKGDVVEDGEMRIQRVVLKDHRDVAARRLELVDAAIADPDFTGVERFESGQQPQQRRLAAARRPEQDEALARFHVEADPIDGVVRAEPFGDALEADSHEKAQYTPRL